MTDDAGGRDTAARPLLVIATDAPDQALELEFDSATVVAASDPPGTWPDEAIAGLYLDLNSTVPEGLLTRVFERAAREAADAAVVLGVRGDPLPPVVQAELDAASRGWAVVTVRPAAGGAVVELRRAAGDGDLEQDGRGGSVPVIEGTAALLRAAAPLHDDVVRLGQQADAADAQARRLREACEHQRVEIVRLQDLLKAEWQLRRAAQADVQKARADLMSAQQRVARIEQSRLGRLVRRSWRVRRLATRPVARLRRLAARPVARLRRLADLARPS